MANKKFEIGDVVTLNSGGPAMTIRSFDANGDCRCEWFAEGQADKSVGFFHPDMLCKPLTQDDKKALREAVR